MLRYAHKMEIGCEIISPVKEDNILVDVALQDRTRTNQTHWQEFPNGGSIMWRERLNPHSQCVLLQQWNWSQHSWTRFDIMGLAQILYFVHKIDPFMSKATVGAIMSDDRLNPAS